MSQIGKATRGWLARLGGLFHRAQRDAEFAAELEAHLEFHFEANLRAGMTPEAARREALIRLGGLEQTKQLYRDRRGIPLLERRNCVSAHALWRRTVRSWPPPC